MAAEWPCALCGSTQHIAVFEAGKAQSNRIVRCLACGFMFASPRLAPADAEKVLTYDPDYLEEMLTRDRDSRRSKEARQVRDFNASFQLLARHFPQPGRVLEVGFGLGFLLLEFQNRGWDAHGIDPDRLCTRHAKEHLKLNVQAATLEQAGLPAEHFDVIVLMHVIEHVPDPAATVRLLTNLLKPGGMLIMETPRFDTLAFALLRHRERSMACEGHLSFFTWSSLRRLCEHQGLKVCAQHRVARTLTLDRLLWNLGVVSKNARLQAGLDSLSARWCLDRFWLRLGVGDIQRISVLKPRQAPAPPGI